MQLMWTRLRGSVGERSVALPSSPKPSPKQTKHELSLNCHHRAFISSDRFRSVRISVRISSLVSKVCSSCILPLLHPRLPLVPQEVKHCEDSFADLRSRGAPDEGPSYADGDVASQVGTILAG